MELIFSWTLRVHWCTGLQPLAGGGVQKLQFVINLSGSTGGDGFIECCRGSKRRIKEGVKSLSCK
jgi:hypothetical protein